MTVFQVQFGVEQSSPLAPQLTTTLPIPFIFLIVAAIGLVVLVLLALRAALRSRYLKPEAYDFVTLLVTVPRESSEQAANEESIEQIRSQIALAETWLGAFGGMRAQRGLRTWLFGRHDHFSLEIVVQNSLISFYVVVPEYLQQMMEQQILAQHPEAGITLVEEYNLFKPQSVVLSSYISFKEDYIFPLNTYNKLSADPLQSITNALSNIAPNDGLAIQIVARSAKGTWHDRGKKVARLMHQGKTLSEAMSAVGTRSAVGVLTGIVNFFNASNNKQDQDDQQRHTPTPLEQEQIQGIEEKTSKAGLDCNIRIVVSAENQVAAKRYLDNALGAFNQFNFYQYGNSLKSVNTKPGKLVPDFIYRSYRESQKLILNTEELASIFHLPTPYLDTPNIRWLLARKIAAPHGVPVRGLLLGENVYRGKHTNIFLSPGDRQRHMYIIGMTGTGKSALLSNLAVQDIKNGKGVCVIDPHGSLVEDIMQQIPRERIDDVVYFNPSDTQRPIGLNMLEASTPEEQDFVTQEMIAIFYKLVTDPSMIGPMFEHNMRNAILTLMADKESPGTIAEIPRMFSDPKFQKYKVGKVTDPVVRAYWEQEMAKTSDFHKSEMLGYLISKVGRFIENAMIRNIVGQPTSGFNFRKIMDEQKILLVNLSKGVTGEVNSNLLGLIIVSKLQMAALSRANMPEAERKDFYLYIDEFQNFITDSISTILAEARKYKLNLIMAHQYLGQLSAGGVEGKGYGDKIRNAIFGNVGTMVSFRIGSEDAEHIAKQFAPTVNEYDLTNIERFNAYVRLLVDNQPMRPLHMQTFPPEKGDQTIAEDIRQFSRWKYGKDVRTVEKDIMERSQLGAQKADRIVPPMPSAR